MYADQHTTVFAALVRAATYSLAVFLAMILAGCGGGGGDDTPVTTPPTPTIASFTSDRPSYFRGDEPLVTAVFSGGTGRIFDMSLPNGSVAVSSGQAITLPQLAASSEIKLVVESGTNSINKLLALPVAVRGRYTPVSGQLGATGHEVVALADGGALIVGGSRGEGVLSNSIDRLDATAKLSRVGSLTSGRERHKLVVLASGDILVAGGVRALAGVSNAELIDGKTWVSAPVGTMSTTRVDHTATLLGNGRVLITGGRTPERFPEGYSPTAEIYDPQTRSFRKLTTTMKSARASHSAVLLKNGRVLIVGGYSSGSYVFAEIFDPETESFTAITSPVDTPRAQLVVERTSDGNVLIAGGESQAMNPSDEVLVYSTATNAIIASAVRLTKAVSLAQGGLLPDGTIGMFGGVTSAEEPFGITTALSVGAKSPAEPIKLTVLPDLPDPRIWHRAVTLTDGRLLIVGGQRGLGYASTLYLFE
jgi:hypothetical protein